MADKGSRLAVTRVLAVLLAAVLAMELVPAAAFAETMSMREETVVTEAAGDTGEMAAEESAGREAPAPVAADQPNQGVEEVSVAPQADSAPVADPVPVDEAAETGLDTQSITVSAPRVRADSSMQSGQVVTWDCVWLGSYPQTEVAETDALRSASWKDGDATVGGVRYRRVSRSNAGTYRYFRYEPIKWRVLEVSGTTALVVADKGLDSGRYNEVYTDVTWATSSVRSWLNGYAASANQPGWDCTSDNFLATAFTADERGSVLQSAVANSDSVSYGTDGGPDTSDHVFLLSETDVWGAAATAHGFVSDSETKDEARCCKPTDYACAMGAYASSGDYDEYDGCCAWWLRSPGHVGVRAAVVGADGRTVYNSQVDDGGLVGRPALRLNLSSPLVHPAGTVSSDGSSSPVSAPTPTPEPTPEPTPTKPFPDVPAGAWYEGVVYRAVGLGFISGYGNGNFGPDDNITRGQVAVVLWKMAGQPAAGAGARDFPDVKADDYFRDAVRWASGAGVVNGYADGRFGPNDNVTREQLATMLANYARNVARKPVEGSVDDCAGMEDKAEVSEWAREAIGWCFKSGIISGAGKYIQPQGNATRAQAAKMVVVMHDLL